MDQFTEPESTLGRAETHHYAVRHVERFELGKSCSTIVECIRDLFFQKPLRGSILAVDMSEVGPAIVADCKIKHKSAIRPITITRSNATVEDGAGWYVPEYDLACLLQLLLASERLIMAKDLQKPDVLVNDLQTFNVKTAFTNEAYEAWTCANLNDTVRAIGVAAWIAERTKD